LASVLEQIAAVPWNLDPGAKRVRMVKSAERALALFEQFSLCQRPMSVGEIAKALQMPQPSVSMLVRTLTALGYLEQDRKARNYVPTIRIMLLGSWIHRRVNEEQNLERRIRELTQKVGETVMMGIQNGIYSQYVFVQMPTDPDLVVQSGMLRPITCTAIGRAILSLKPDAEIEAIVRRCNAEVDEPRLRVRVPEFMDIVAGVRASGHARTSGDMTPGRAVIAVSIPGPLGKMSMAVGIGGLVKQIAAKEALILEALQEFRAAGVQE
jgi:DNA-binding IclR family transcriptional regulator